MYNVDGNLAALAKYEQEQEEVENRWEEMVAVVETNYLKEYQNIIEAVQRTIEQYGFDYDAQTLLEEI